jgi:hypothetical protein
MLKKSLIVLILLVLLSSCIGCQSRMTSSESTTKPSDTTTGKPTDTKTTGTASTKTSTTPDIKATPPEVSNLKVVGQIGGPVQAVAVNGNYAFVGVGMRLMVLDISDSAAPREIGAAGPFGWYVEDVFIAGNTAFVATGGSGLYIIDISDPTRPALAGNYDTLGYSEAVVVSKTYAFIADGPNGVLVLDVGDYSHPVEVASVYTNNYAFDVFIQDSYIYIAAAGAGLLIADISSPSAPEEIASLNTPGYAYGVTVSGNTAFIADGWGGLSIVDIADPASPFEVNSVETSGWVVDVVVEQNTAYLADITSGVYLSDVSDPMRPSKPTGLWGEKQESSGWHTVNLGFKQGLLFVIDRNTGLWLIDLANPEKPAAAGLYSPLNFAGSIDVSGVYGYVAGTFAYPSTLRLLDLSDLTRPREVMIHESKEPLKCIKLSDKVAYTFGYSDGECISALDISNPGQPKILSSQILDGPPANLLLSENIAYVTTEFGFELIDISNPVAISRLGVLDFTGGLGRAKGAASAWGAAVSDTLAFVTYSDTLFIIDISNPTSPAILTSFKPPDMLKAGPIVFDGHYAFIAVVGGIAPVDISNPKEPRVVSRCSLPGGASQLVLKDRILYSASEAEGVLVIDVNDPENPVLIGSSRLPGRTYDIAVDNEYIYAANGEGGVYILERFSDNNIPGSTSIGSFGAGAKALGFLTSSISEKSITGHEPASSGPDFDNESFAIPDVFPGSGNTLTVTGEADSGTGTLRWALENARSGDVITFDSVIFSPQKPLTIKLNSPLPYLNQGSLTIDASNTGVILDGGATPKGTHGLVINSDNNIIKGLQVISFPGAGIGIAGGSYNTIGGDRTVGKGPTGEGNVVSGNGMVGIGISDSIRGIVSDTGNSSDKPTSPEEKVTMGNRIIGNYIGTDNTGSKAFGSQGTGIWIFGKIVSQNIIGGSTPNERNVISGNVRAGVTLLGAVNRNIIDGNYIGTDVSGTKSIGNDWMGVTIEGSFSNIIKGNVISGNGNGLIITDPGAYGNEVIGNFIGTDATGTMGLPNRGVGVSINESFNRVGGATSEERNIISGNIQAGIQIGWRSTTEVVVIGNFIGIDVTGTKALGNSSSGIDFNEDAYHNIVGGFTSVERNIISGNAGEGISLGSQGQRSNSIIGNYIGTDASGKIAIPDKDNGIGIYAAAYNYVIGNTIAFNSGGILIKLGTGNSIYHNNFKENNKTSDGGYNNQWDNCREGNYWSDYTGKDSNRDGIGDTPYSVPPNGKDNYPLFKPYHE